ncbi:MAG: hypothetical protein RR090_00285 [Niameybacter sp.]|uniref:DUF6115 domain-containing protein n=1 Tax=Niameybacter sp. TaxID=2033640 RepID=UPI002FCC35A4
MTTRSVEVLYLAQEETKCYDEIIRFSEEGLSVEDIAKKVNKGKSEVQLMLSLYKMR